MIRIKNVRIIIILNRNRVVINVFTKNLKFHIVWQFSEIFMYLNNDQF